MVIYIDLVFLINFMFDLFLLMTINVALKRYVNIRRLILGALVGSITLISLFLPINGLVLSLLKVGIGVLMVVASFGYKNIRYTFYNALYLFMTSIIMGGFLYYLKLEFNSRVDGVYYMGIQLNYLILVVLAPLILYVFLKSLKALREIKNYYYSVRIVFDNNFTLDITGFLDTGNKLVDPVTGKPIILLNKKVIKGKYNIRSPMYVPFNSLNHHGLIMCVKVKELYINNQEVKNYLVGFTDTNFKLNGIDCLLNYKVWEDINDK